MCNIYIHIYILMCAIKECFYHKNNWLTYTHICLTNKGKLRQEQKIFFCLHRSTASQNQFRLLSLSWLYFFRVFVDLEVGIKYVNLTVKKYVIIRTLLTTRISFESSQIKVYQILQHSHVRVLGIHFLLYGQHTKLAYTLYFYTETVIK